MILLSRETKTKQEQLLEATDRWILDWNNEHPLDRWWRSRHKIPFGSAQHLSASHLDMFFEYREQVLASRRAKKEDDEDMNFNEGEELALGIDKSTSSKEVVKMTKEQVDVDFDNLDPVAFSPSAKGDKTSNIL